ncbi:hypothetical protein HK405_013403, partial [Cladochytrium tenue]
MATATGDDASDDADIHQQPGDGAGVEAAWDEKPRDISVVLPVTHVPLAVARGSPARVLSGLVAATIRVLTVLLFEIAAVPAVDEHWLRRETGLWDWFRPRDRGTNRNGFEGRGSGDGGTTQDHNIGCDNDAKKVPAYDGGGDGDGDVDEPNVSVEDIIEELSGRSSAGGSRTRLLGDDGPETASDGESRQGAEAVGWGRFQSPRMEETYLREILLANRIRIYRGVNLLGLLLIVVIPPVFPYDFLRMNAVAFSLLLASMLLIGVFLGALDFYITPNISDIVGSAASIALLGCNLQSGVAFTLYEQFLFLAILCIFVAGKATVIGLRGPSVLGVVIYLVPIFISACFTTDMLFHRDMEKRMSFLKMKLVEHQLLGLRDEQRKTEYLLSLTLPPPIVEKLREVGTAAYNLAATIMFLDVKNYKDMAENLGSKRDSVILLNMIFLKIDEVIAKYPGIERIKVYGDTVNTSSRMLSMAQGGQIITTSEVWTVVNNDLECESPPVEMSTKTTIKAIPVLQLDTTIIQSAIFNRAAVKVSQLPSPLSGVSSLSSMALGVPSSRRSMRKPSVGPGQDFDARILEELDETELFLRERASELGRQLQQRADSAAGGAYPGGAGISESRTNSRRTTVRVPATPSLSLISGSSQRTDTTSGPVSTPERDFATAWSSRRQSVGFVSTSPNQSTRRSTKTTVQLGSKKLGSGTISQWQSNQFGRPTSARAGGVARVQLIDYHEGGTTGGGGGGGSARVVPSLPSLQEIRSSEPAGRNASAGVSTVDMNLSAIPSENTLEPSLRNSSRAIDVVAAPLAGAVGGGGPRALLPVDEVAGGNVPGRAVSAEVCDEEPPTMSVATVTRWSKDRPRGRVVSTYDQELGVQPEQSRTKSWYRVDDDVAELVRPRQHGQGPVVPADAVNFFFRKNKFIGADVQFRRAELEAGYLEARIETVCSSLLRACVKSIVFQISVLILGMVNLLIQRGYIGVPTGSSDTSEPPVNNVSFWYTVIGISFGATGTLVFFTGLTFGGSPPPILWQMALASWSVLSSMIVTTFVLVNWSHLNDYFLMTTVTLPNLAIVLIFLHIPLPFVHRLCLTLAFTLGVGIYISTTSFSPWLVQFFPTILAVYLALMAAVQEGSARLNYLMDRVLQTQSDMTKMEIEKSNQVLNTVLPSRIIMRLLSNPKEIFYEEFPMATVLHMDIAGFTSMSSTIEPMHIFVMLNDLFTYFDCLTEDYNVEKITTIGDAYVASSRLNAEADPTLSAISVCIVALKMQSYAKHQLNESQFMKVELKQKVNMRIGVHTAPCHGSIMGGSTNFRYDLMGDA